MGEKNLIFFVILLIILSFIFLFSSHFYSWIIEKDTNFMDITLKILSRNILYITGLISGLLFPVSLLRKFRFFISWGLLIFLALPIMMKISIKDTYRWIPLGGFTIQPSEIFKIGFLLQISNFLSGNLNKIKIIGFLTFVLISIILLYLTPHFSVIISLLFVTISLLFLKGINLKWLSISSFSVFMILISLIFIKRDYVLERIKSFKEKKIHYQVKQAKIAISRGGFWGVGIGKGKIKYKFLPDLSKDFIFSLIAEETGFIGVFILLFIYLNIIKSLIDGGISINDEFYKTFVLGVALFTFFNVFVHIGVNLGIIPVTGVPLPLISYGGSSGITFSFLFGTSYKIMKEKEKFKDEEVKILWPRYSL